MRRLLQLSTIASAIIVLQACAPLAQRPLDVSLKHPEVIQVLTSGMELITFQASAPQKPLHTISIKGLKKGDSIIGMDYSASQKTMYVVALSGQVYTLDGSQGTLTPRGSNPNIKLTGSSFGVALEPNSEYLRVLSNKGQNLRFKTETGVLASVDNTLFYAENDNQESSVSNVAASVYAPTQFAIDVRLGTLVHQTANTATNSGSLTTIGHLNTGPLQHVTFDASNNNTAFMLAQPGNQNHSSLYVVDLVSGAAKSIGHLNQDHIVIGLAVIEPQP